ncbi:hypothetical protein CCHL11_00489 [Colletotrichum chlorophyti]|uniref:Cryptic loci regulator 2 C-terminal domain-containing protein n=1 Tax=Colletotrichum chlorophyti TaxID=708187 RepID=A0A1Q8RVA2_9PEZI|nr:hypothetical protein CCHL11_00489 [Colletotrichum chlorophyti]
MSDLTEYAIVNICRSDGQDNGPGYWPAPVDAAKSTKKTPEKVPRAKPQMVRLAEDDPRFQEWRVKLGILLKQELSHTEGLPWLLNFPRGYWLYEKSKHLWVSGYPVKSKLFKSPQEFGLHLLWLLSSSTDRNDCRCIHCNVRAMPNIDDLTVTEVPKPIPAPTNAPPPPKMRKITPQVTPKTASPALAPAQVPQVGKEVPAQTTKQETPVPVPSTPQITPGSTPVQTAGPAHAPIQQTPAQPSQAPVPVQPPVPAPAQVSLQPRVQTPVQPPQQAPAQVVYQQPTFYPYPAPPDGIVAGPLFRVGELVWFQMASGWRLGILAVPAVFNQATKQTEPLNIFPISHALFNQSPVQAHEASTRPFLAFSVPDVGISDLLGKAYDDVPWDTFLRSLPPDDTHRREITLLDSSKMAAQKIGQSYSVYTRLSETEGGKKVDYHGIFLGAERIELGDALRVRISAEQGLPSAATNLPDALLGLREICTAPIDSPGTVFFKGDIYQPLMGDKTPVCGIPIPNERLPRPLREEVAFRNKFAPKDRWRCVLLKQNAVLREADLKGRFYPSYKLLPLLEGAKVSAELQKGIVTDVHQRLNQRIDTFKTGYIGRKRTRAETIGPALPAGTSIQFESSVREEAI